MSTSTKPEALNFINGHLIDGDRVGDSISPASGAVLGTYADAGAAQAQAAITTARATFETSDWSRDRHLRHRVLNALADGIDRRSEDLISMLAAERQGPRRCRPGGRLYRGHKAPGLDRAGQRDPPRDLRRDPWAALVRLSSVRSATSPRTATASCATQEWPSSTCPYRFIRTSAPAGALHLRGPDRCMSISRNRPAKLDSS